MDNYESTDSPLYIAPGGNSATNPLYMSHGEIPHDNYYSLVLLRYNDIRLRDRIRS